jgi:hypothetical protein
MTTLIGRHCDGIRIFLNGSIDDLLGTAVVPQMDDLCALVLEDPSWPSKRLAAVTNRTGRIRTPGQGKITEVEGDPLWRPPTPCIIEEMARLFKSSEPEVADIWEWSAYRQFIRLPRAVQALDFSS